MSEKENMIEEEVDEAKIRVVEDYGVLVKDFRIVPSKTKYGTFYNIQVTVENLDTPITVRVDNDVVRLISLAGKLGKQAVKTKELLKEENIEKQKTYICCKLTMFDDKVYRYFISRADESALSLLLANVNEKNTAKI